MISIFCLKLKSNHPQEKVNIMIAIHPQVWRDLKLETLDSLHNNHQSTKIMRAYNNSKMRQEENKQNKGKLKLKC